MADENQMDRGPAVPQQVEEKAERGASYLRKEAAELSSAAGAIAEEYQSRAEKAWDDARRRVRVFHDDSEQYVRENPAKAIFTALGVGLVLGMLYRR
jgi:ElaB/YqjD/DUF883 family membrane-anchored ribosome-binding protein